MANNLVKMCGNLSLSEEEEQGVTLLVQDLVEIRPESDLCLGEGSQWKI
jgi:hypothetical protein